MRVFIGLEIPENIKQDIHRYLLPIQKTPKGWEDPHDFHQTLLYIGEVSEQELEIISYRLDQIKFQPFLLETNGFQFFNRRIMYLGLKKNLELDKLKVAVDEHFREWVQPLAKPFLPHVTVKRWQRYEYQYLEEALKRHPFDGVQFMVTGITLFQSEKDTSNRKYHVIKTKNF